MVQTLFDRLFPRGEGGDGAALATMLAENGFDPEQHERIRSDLSMGASVFRKTAFLPTR